MVDFKQELHPLVSLCYVSDSSLEKCDRRLNHSGMHSWELFKEIQRLERLLDLAYKKL